MKMYSEQVKNYFNTDLYCGEIHDVGVIHLHEENEHLQYEIDFYVKADASKVVDAKFKVFGDPNVISCMAWLCEQLIDKDLNSLEPMNPVEVGQALELHITKLYAATLVQKFTLQLLEKMNG